MWMHKTPQEYTVSHLDVLELGAPHWFVLATLGAFLGAMYRRFRLQRRRLLRHRHGHCENCGYDLRASGDVAS
jgi:hypothetical protein